MSTEPEQHQPNHRATRPPETQAELVLRALAWAVIWFNAGWVTDLVKRNDALRILGNAVVWRQAAYAYRELLGGGA